MQGMKGELASTTPWRRIWRRARVEGRDLLEVVLLPGLAMVLPWRISFALFKWMARWSWLYRDTCERALHHARLYGMVDDPARWLWERRLVTLVDHADHYLSRSRSDAWWRRNMDVHGDWAVQGQPALLVTFHWACGMWAQRHARASGLHPHMLVAALDGSGLAGRAVLRHYAQARLATVAMAEGRPVISVPGAMHALRAALDEREQILVVIDVPPDQVKVRTSVTVLGRTVQVPAALPRLAVERGMAVTVYTLGIDLESGRRDLRLYPLGIWSDAEQLTEKIFQHFAVIVQSRPASWHFWSEAERFFAQPTVQPERSN